MHILQVKNNCSSYELDDLGYGIFHSALGCSTGCTNTYPGVISAYLRIYPFTLEKNPIIEFVYVRVAFYMIIGSHVELSIKNNVYEINIMINLQNTRKPSSFMIMLPCERFWGFRTSFYLVMAKQYIS